MRVKNIFIGLLLVIWVVSCDASPPQSPTIESTVTVIDDVDPPIPSETPVPTETETLVPSPTVTSTPVPTSTSTPTVEPSPTETVPVEKIFIGVPENPENFSSMVYISFQADQNQFDTIIANTMASPAVAICPTIWVQPLEGQANPSFNMFIQASAEDSFAVSIRPTGTGMAPYGIVGIVAIPEGGDENIVLGIIYPVSGSQMPDEMEVQAIIPGCGIYSLLLPWP